MRLLLCGLFQTEANAIPVLEDKNGDNLGDDDVLGNSPVYKAFSPAENDINSGFGDEGEQRQEEEQMLGKTGTDSARIRHFPKRLSRWEVAHSTR